MIPFNKPLITGREIYHLKIAVEVQMKICGDGDYTRKCNKWLENQTDSKKVLLTTSCTHAIEMSAILLNISDGDEVIAPSYTFVSTVNPFVLRGAKIVFVDVRQDTMNIDETLIEAAITEKTKAIIVVHYAGISCEMDKIMEVAKKYNIPVVEDAAQGVMSSYNGKALGSIGSLGAFSFHETKNYTMGEGGALIINDDKYSERAEILREKGTNRSKFLNGQVDKYTWVDIGSSYLPSDINAALLYGQLEFAVEVNEKRRAIWQSYYNGLKIISDNKKIELPTVPTGCEHNGHLFYIKCKDVSERSELILYLRDKGVQATFHYVPLHSSNAGLRFGTFNGIDRYTTLESERLLRLPLYYSMTDVEIFKVIAEIKNYYHE